ncbi:MULTISPECIES: DoxX family protein [unclassified Streptomyces]|uniref:DoxX family protein n=1 Tax=unclassified Streptomyces TaxID=2593676 RepID=UPI0038185CB5
MTSSLGTIPSARIGAPPRPAPSSYGYDVGLLVLRLGLGLTMAVHGAQKLLGWFGGPGLDGTGQFFAMSGYPAGRTMAVVAGLSEMLGGLGLVVGLLTPLAAAAIVGTMINALAVKWGGGFFAPKGVEYELLLTAGAAALALTGPGRCAVDRFLPVLRAQRLVHGVAAVVLALVVAGIVLLVRK